ncbi:hypothetical protein Dimus_032079, partial [Dionaea muscipula]
MKAAEDEVDAVQQSKIRLLIKRDTEKNERRKSMADLDDEKTKNEAEQTKESSTRATPDQTREGTVIPTPLPEAGKQSGTQTSTPSNEAEKNDVPQENDDQAQNDLNKEQLAAQDSSVLTDVILGGETPSSD